ncbi:hypothetical protein RBB50_009978 [Rhinocladiella similis]
MAFSRTPSPTPSYSSTATTLVSTNTAPSDNSHLHNVIEESGDIRMINLSSETRSLLQMVTELPLFITKTCGRYEMTLGIWGTSPRSLTTIQYRLIIEGPPLNITTTNDDDEVPFADILTHFEEVTFDDDEVDLICNQLRQPLYLRRWLDSIDELVDEAIRDVRTRMGICEDDDNDNENNYES